MLKFLVIGQSFAGLKPGVVKSLLPGRISWQQRADATHAHHLQPSFQLSKQSAADAAIAPPCAESQQEHPRPLTLSLRHCQAHKLISYDCDDSRLARPSSSHHFRHGKHRCRFVGLATLIPHLNRLVEITVVKIAKTPRGHGNPPHKWPS